MRHQLTRRQAVLGAAEGTVLPRNRVVSQYSVLGDFGMQTLPTPAVKAPAVEGNHPEDDPPISCCERAACAFCVGGVQREASPASPSPAGSYIIVADVIGTGKR